MQHQIKKMTFHCRAQCSMFPPPTCPKNISYRLAAAWKEKLCGINDILKGCHVFVAVILFKAGKCCKGLLLSAATGSVNSKYTRIYTFLQLFIFELILLLKYISFSGFIRLDFFFFESHASLK